MERRDNWVTNPTMLSRSSLSRTHSHLIHGPELLRQSTQYEYSPRAEHPEELIKTSSLPLDDDTKQSRPHHGPIINISEDHVTPEWYHLSLIKMASKHDSIAPKLTREKSVVENEIQEACSMIQTACDLRDKWCYKNIKQKGHIGSIIADKDVCLDVDRMKHILPKSIEQTYSFKFIDGIARIYKTKVEEIKEDMEDDQNTRNEIEIFELYSFNEYITDIKFIYQLMAFGPAKTLCYKRLKILQCRFKLHLLLNNEVESTEAHSVPYRDFYNVRKIDNHVHHSACMHQKHLLRFMKDKYRSEPNKIVNKDNKTLKQIFDELGINIELLSVDKLDVHAQQQTFQRFDKFNAKYNPMGIRPLRTLFLKIDNEIKGEFLAGITKEVFRDLEYQKYQFAEYRLSIYGKKKSEWDIVSDWICNNHLHSAQVRWLIQIPRIYPIFKKSNIVSNFHEMLSNIFEPLFEVTMNPLSHPSLHLFLELIVGFDSVDDESIPESMENHKHPSPSNYDFETNPPYIYYMYYMWINVYKLNKLREERGFNTFALRPHSGEAGSLNHLASTFLLSESINHGIRLRYSPILQYLYYLKQIGISVSPLSNNILFEEYDKNPFPLFFQRGLNVTLSSDDPLLIHYTKDALLEEYSIAAQVYNLSAIDLCEIARNSVLQCGWDRKTKMEWIGKNYLLKYGAAANDIYRTNVPNSRLQFRRLLLKEETVFITSKGKEVLTKSKFFNKTAINNNIKPLLPVIDSDSDEMLIKPPQVKKKKKKKKKPNRLELPLKTPTILQMQSRKSWDTDELEDDENNTTNCNDYISYNNTEIVGSIDGLLQMIDTLYNSTNDNNNINISDIKGFGLKDKNNKILYKPQKNNVNNKKEKIFVDTIFGKGYIINKTNTHYTINMKNMITSIQKSECRILNNTYGLFVQTFIGNGIIIDTSNDNKYFIIEMNNMIVSMHKNKCKIIIIKDNNISSEMDNNNNNIALRDIYDSDLKRVYQLEINSYPSDEAASKEKLYYRFIYAKKYFKVFTVNGIVIGFICGTKTKDGKLTDESMSIHDRNGKHLCIHSVVIDKKYRRNGYGNKMMRLYVKQEIGSSYNSSLSSIRLCCKKHLISFYGDCGFRLIGQSNLDHGKDKWYEMAIEITHE